MTLHKQSGLKRAMKQGFGGRDGEETSLLVQSPLDFCNLRPELPNLSGLAARREREDQGNVHTHPYAN